MSWCKASTRGINGLMTEMVLGEINEILFLSQICIPYLSHFKKILMLKY